MSSRKIDFLNWVLSIPKPKGSGQHILRNLLSYYGFWMLSLTQMIIGEKFNISKSRVQQINNEMEKRFKRSGMIKNFINFDIIDQDIPDKFLVNSGQIFFMFTSFGKDISKIFDKFWLEDYNIEKIVIEIQNYQKKLEKD